MPRKAIVGSSAGSRPDARSVQHRPRRDKRVALKPATAHRMIRGAGVLDKETNIHKKGGKPERITPTVLYELICRHACCVHDQEGRCPLLLFIQPMCWELNMYFGVGNEEDRGFRRCSEISAARPLSKEHEE